MIKVLNTREEEIIDRILSKHDVLDVINILNLDEADAIRLLIDNNWEGIENFVDVITEMDYEEDGEDE